MKIRVEDHGTVVLLHPDAAAQDWVSDHVLLGDYNPDFPERVIAEPRYVRAVLEGFVADGGEVSQER